MARQIVLYVRSEGCGHVRRTRRDLTEWNIPFREVNIDDNEAVAHRLEEWTGFRPVPTVVVANEGSDLPHEEPAGLTPGQSPRNVDRGSIISEPNTANLAVFLEHNGFIPVDLYRMGSFLRG